MHDHLGCPLQERRLRIIPIRQHGRYFLGLKFFALNQFRNLRKIYPWIRDAGGSVELFAYICIKGIAVPLWK